MHLVGPMTSKQINAEPSEVRRGGLSLEVGKGSGTVVEKKKLRILACREETRRFYFNVVKDGH